MSKPDFSAYTTTELFEALESIDDQQYPERTREIIGLIMQRTQTSKEDLIAAYSGNPATVLLDVVTLFTGLGIEQSMLDNTVPEKIRRALALPAENTVSDGR
jgi:hypothetical protein